MCSNSQLQHAQTPSGSQRSPPTWNMMLAKRKVGANWPTMEGDLSLGCGNSARPTSQLQGKAGQAEDGAGRVR